MGRFLMLLAVLVLLFQINQSEERSKITINDKCPYHQQPVTSAVHYISSPWQLHLLYLQSLMMNKRQWYRHHNECVVTCKADTVWCLCVWCCLVLVFRAWQGKTPLRARLTKSNVIISAKLIYPAQLNVGPGHGWDAVCMGVHGDAEAWRIIKIEIISLVVPLLPRCPLPLT